MNGCTAPILVFGYGNPSRGDDALGPLMIERLAQRQAVGALRSVDLLTDFQLQIEHALDLQARQRVIFVDADASIEGCFRLLPVVPLRDPSYTSHAVSPGALLHVTDQIQGVPPERCELLAIRGHGFDLGSPLSGQAQNNLDMAEAFLLRELGACRPSGA